MYKRTSLSLLKSAAKSDAAAQRAFALAQAAQTKAGKARELAGVAEAKERVADLTKAEVAAKLIQANASATHTAAITDSNALWASYQAAKKNEEVTKSALVAADGNLNVAQRAADAERAQLKTTE
jgi:hypothetical protein